MKKRILAMLLALTMIFSMVPVQAFASETEPAEVAEQIIETTEAVTEAPQEEPEETTAPPVTEAEPEETTAPQVTEPEETTAPAETEAEVEETAAAEMAAEVVVQEKAAAAVTAAEPADSVKVTMTIAAYGNLELARKEVTVKDLDSDGLLTFDEALTAAHKAYYKGDGEGYVSLPGSYGLQVGLLWGHGNGDFVNGMFFTNDVPNQMNVGESYVAEGDDLYASNMYDDNSFNDWYTYFDKKEVTVKAGQEFTLTLKGFPGMTWGEPVPNAIPGATVGTWDEDFTALSGKTTDDSGKVTLSFAEAGTYVVSATGTVMDDSMGMEVPIMVPACVVTVEANQEAPKEPEVIGKVHVIVENTTYTDETAPWSGTLVDTEVTLTDDMSMMTAILTALKQNGHSWLGTGAADPAGMGITYISEIRKNGTVILGEFDGGQQSGWMGTLNGWMLNRGFEQWKAGVDVLDGDEIRVMYTVNYGEDLGAKPSANEGYLSSLTASVGTLSPAFDKQEAYYTLTVEEGVTALDIQAVAENKLDRITVSVGETKYHRGEDVAVADGTEILITCGAKTYNVEVDVAEPAPSWPFILSVGEDVLEVTDLGTTETCTKLYGTAKKMEVTVPAGTKTIVAKGVNGALTIYPNHGAQKNATTGTGAEIEVSEGSYLCMRDMIGGGWYHVAVKFAPCEHNWVDATCKAPKTCSVCGATEGEANPDAHNYVNGTCEYCGEAEPSAAPLNVTAGGEAVEVEFIENSDGQNWYFASVKNVNLEISGTAENPLTAAEDALTWEKIAVNGGIASVSIQNISLWTLAELPAEITGLIQPGTEGCYAVMFTLQNSLGTSGGNYGFLFVEFTCEHNWADATCQAPKTCSKCGLTEGEVGDHSYVDGTCSVCGKAESTPTPFSEKISVPSNGDSTWGNINGLTLSGTDGSIYEAYWSSTTNNNFVLDVILGQDTDLDATITAEFSRGGSIGDRYKPTISGDLTVTLVDGKGTINMHAEAYSNAVFYPHTDWTINLIVDDGSAANRPTYAVTLPTETVGYTVTAYNSESPVIGGRSFSFKLAVENTYTKDENFKVLVNGEEITGSNDIYTITDITEPKTVTVEGIREKTLAELNVTIIAPEGSTISTGRHYSYFKYDFDEPLEVTTLDDGRIQYVAPVPGSQNFLRVQHPEGVTYWTFDGMGAGSVFEITEEMLFIGSSEFTRDTVYHNFEKNVKDKADLYMTVNEKGWLDMGVGDTWNLNIFRNFLSLGNSVTNNSVALPDTHYQVISVNGSPSDVVSVTPDANNSCYAEIKAEKPGTAIILVTYDAVYNNKGEGGKQWSALWPENTGVIVVTVDQATGGITTNMTVNEEANASGKQVIDAEHDILFYVGDQGASYSFKPEEGASVSVNRSSVGSKMTFSGFTRSGISTAADGTVTVTGLTTGTHILRVTKGGKSVYQVVRARQVSYDLKHSDGSAVTAYNPAKPGETVTVQFHNLISPMEKLSGVYNTNFAFRYSTASGSLVQSSPSSGYGIYDFSGNESHQKFTVTIPSYWNESAYGLTKGAIKLGGYGSSAGAHRTTTYIAGKEVNTNASGVSGYLAVLPDILIQTTPVGYESFNVTLPTGEGYTVSGGSVPVPEGETYTFTVTVAKGYDAVNMVVKVNGETVEPVDGTYSVADVREDLVVTVEGVTKYPETDMTLSTVLYSKADTDTYWGRENYGWVDTVTFGGAEVDSYTWDGDTCNVVLTYDTPKNGFVGFAFTAAGRNDSYAGRVSATLDGVAMTAGVPTSVKIVDGTATVQLYAQYQRASYGATKTFVLTVMETPDEVVEAVANVNALIDAIQLPVDLEDKEAILAAWNAYQNLTENQKRMIPNADLLLQAKAELDNLMAVKLTGGKTVTLTSTLSGKPTWSLAEEYAPFATINSKSGKMTARKVVELVSVYAVATDAEGNTETVRVDIYPAVSQVKILDAQEALVNGKTVPVKVNDGSDGTIVFSAGTYPADAQDAVTWTVSDTKGAYVTYEVNGNRITLNPAENVKKGTVTLTATAADGSGKKATVKLNIAVLAEGVAITGDNTVASGKSITLKAAPTNDNTTDKSIAWSIAEGKDYATITSSGKLTAAKDLMDVKTVVVRASAKDGSGAYADAEIKVTPLALGVQMYNGSKVCSNTALTHNMTAQDTLSLRARVYPLGKANQAVTWKSSSTKIATVTVDENGNATVTCLKPGKVTITATAADGSKEKASFTLTIVKGVDRLTLEDQVIAVKKNLNLGKLIRINPTDATNKKLEWKLIGETHGATITSSGVLKTKNVDVSGGPVELTVSAAPLDGCGATPAVCTVTVYPATTKSGMVVKSGETVVGKKDVLTLEPGQELKLTGYCEGAANVYTWKSSSNKVQVVDGVVTATEAAISKNAYTITCTAADGTGVKVSVKVKVVAPAVAE